MATKDIADWEVCEAADYCLSTLHFLCELTGQHYKVCIRAMERGESRSLVDLYSAGTARLTYNGRKFLASERKARSADVQERVSAVRRKLDVVRRAEHIEEKQAHADRIASVQRWISELRVE